MDAVSGLVDGGLVGPSESAGSGESLEVSLMIGEVLPG